MAIGELTDKRIGTWQVGDLFQDGARKKYHCVCSVCHRESNIRVEKFSNGNIPGCRCRGRDLAGKTVGRWKVGDRFQKNGKTWYHCTCECGTKRDIIKSSLLQGGSLSCGCLRDDTKHQNVPDLTGKTFGLLTVQNKVIKNHKTYWNCLCACGNTKEVKTNNLVCGLIKSCGCKMDVGEKIRTSLSPLCQDGTYLPTVTNLDHINKNNTSGFRGVSFRPDRGRWRAYIKYQRKNIHLGSFINLKDAIAARKAAELELFGKYLEGENVQNKGTEE